MPRSPRLYTSYATRLPSRRSRAIYKHSMLVTRTIFSRYSTRIILLKQVLRYLGRIVHSTCHVSRCGIELFKVDVFTRHWDELLVSTADAQGCRSHTSFDSNGCCGNSPLEAVAIFGLNTIPNHLQHRNNLTLRAQTSKTALLWKEIQFSHLTPPKSQ